MIVNRERNVSQDLIQCAKSPLAHHAPMDSIQSQIKSPLMLHSESKKTGNLMAKTFD